MRAPYRSSYRQNSLHVARFYGPAVAIDPATYAPQPSTRPAPLPRLPIGATTDTFAANVARAEALEAERLAAERLRLAVMLAAIRGGKRPKRLPLPLLPR